MTEVAIDAVMTRLIAFARATTTLARGLGEGRKVGRKIEERRKRKKRGKRKRKKNKSGGRRGETRRVACSRREEGALGAGWACGKKREEYFEVEESDAGTGGGGARGSCRRGLVRRRSQELAGFPR